MSRFLCWLSAAAPKGGETEISVAVKLAGFRAATGMLKDLSFDSISAAGPHAAILIMGERSVTLRHTKSS
jgi:Xaa-Pro aminopeptidase